jgi:hypothetical protein
VHEKFKKIKDLKEYLKVPISSVDEIWQDVTEPLEPCLPPPKKAKYA